VKTLREQVVKFVAGRAVRGVNYRDVQSKFPGTRADRYLRDLHKEGTLRTEEIRGHRTFFYAR
jgi:hypothetical protein